MDFFAQDKVRQQLKSTKDNSQKIVDEENAFMQQQRNKDKLDYRNHMFDSSYFGGEEESERIINSYKEKIDLSDAEINDIKSNIHERPDFEVLNERQYQDKNFIQKHKYKKKVKKYFKKRNDYRKEADKISKSRKSIQSRKISSLDHTLFNLENKIKLKEKVENYKKQGLFPDIEEDADAIEEAYRNELGNEKFMQAELDIAVEEGKYLQHRQGKGVDALQKYTNSTITCVQMNKYLRGDNADAGYSSYVADGQKALNESKLSRDLVVRRGVKGVQTIGHMLGLPNVDKMSLDEIKQAFDNKKNSGDDVIMTENGFMSTSLPFNAPSYPAEGNTKCPIGVEFIILVKKGTKAVNMTPLSNNVHENELLLKPGTKFKLVDADTNGTADIINGAPGSWKVYLTTIPSEENGVLKEAS